MPGFSQAQLNDLLESELKKWSIDDCCLYREWQFTNWAKAAEAFQLVSELAEHVDHHPRVCVEWGRLALWLKTHDGDFIGEKDLRLALQLNSSIG